MKAIVLEGVNQPLQYTEVPVPVPAADEVLVRVHAAALNHRDLWIQKGQYAGLKFPIILGSDACGVVEQAGKDVDPAWLGKRVLINPSLNWGDNPRVQNKDYVILGLPHDGTLAEYVKIKSTQLHPVPTHLSDREAAAIPLAGLTAYRALCSRAAVKAGEKVLITGVGGGVALWAMQFALALGAEVYVSSGSDLKIARALDLGAKGGVNYKKDNWHKELQQLATAFDVIVDGACGDNFAKLVDLCKPAARIALYGATLGAFNSGVPAKIFWKQIDILGSTMGNNDEFKAMLKLVEDKQIKPLVEQSFSLAHTAQAFELMDKGEQFGKIIIEVKA